MSPDYNDPKRLHDYTSLVIELWDAARSRKPKVTLNLLGEGDSVSGVEEVRLLSHWIMERLEERLALGHEIQDWISFTTDLADGVSKHWRKHGAFTNHADLAAIVFPLIREYSAEK